jgi:hypothetical protein
LASAIVMGLLALVDGVPEAVSIVTWTPGDTAAPAVVAVGCCVKTSRGGASVGERHALKSNSVPMLATLTMALAPAPASRLPIGRSSLPHGLMSAVWRLGDA